MNFNKEAIIFVLQHIKELRQGEHIEQHLSYLERPLATRGGGLYHASFENPCLLAGEVANRLAKCGRDGFFVKVYYCLEESEETIARAFSLPVEEIRNEIISALAYVSNKWPKTEPYQRFRSRRTSLAKTADWRG